MFTLSQEKDFAIYFSVGFHIKNMEEAMEDQQIQSDSESDIIEKIKAQPKVKKPRSQKQQEAWLRCKEARARKVADKKQLKRIKKLSNTLKGKRKQKRNEL